LTPEQAFSHPFISRAVNELKCLKDQPHDKQSSSAAEGGSSKQTLNTTGNGDMASQKSYGGAGGKTKSGSKLPTIRKN
jgi:hypothetical protein